MKKLLVVFLLMISANFYFAQILEETDKLDMVWGEELKLKKGVRYSTLLEASNDNVYLLKTEGQGKKISYAIEVFDEKAHSIREAELDLKYKKDDLSYEGVIKFGNGFVVFGSLSDRKSKTNTLYFKRLDYKTLNEESSWEYLGEMEFLKKKLDGYFSWTLSEDDKKLLVYFNMPLLAKGEAEKFGFRVFDKDMEMEWEKDVQLENNGDMIRVRDFMISNDAQVYVLGSQYNLESIKNSKPEYHILSYSSIGKPKDYELELGNGKYIQEIKFDFDQNGDIVCAGFYTENEKSYSGIKGTFFMRMNTETKEVKKISTKEIDEGFITQDWSDKAIKKAKKKEEKKGKSIEAYSFTLRDFVMHDNGGVTLLAEQYYVDVVTTTYTDSNGNLKTRTTYHYYYKDVYIIDINEKGDVSWISKIDKYQHSTNDGGYRSSYALHVKDDKLYLIFNQYARQYYEKADLKTLPKKERKNYLTFISEVSRDGSIVDELLLNNSKEEIYIVPKSCKQIDQDNTFIFSRKGKNVRMGYLDFN